MAKSHRRDLSKEPPLMAIKAMDYPNTARCPSRPLSSSNCDDDLCPKHEPEEYALWASKHREPTPSDQDLP